MSEPLQAVVREGIVDNVLVMDQATVELFRDLGWLPVLFPGAELFDVTNAIPRPGLGWQRHPGQTPEWANPEPPQDPEPEPEPEPDPEPEPGEGEPGDPPA